MNAESNADLMTEDIEEPVNEERPDETTAPPLLEAQERIAELEKGLLYLQADFHNYRRRKEEEFVAQQKYNAAQLLKDLLPILDNFERALQAAEQSQSFEKLIAGVQGTQKQLSAFLSKAGVSPIDSLGKEFDPTFHEAIGRSADSDAPENTVAEELQKGYMLHDRVLRPAMVKVAGG